jgi:hypothetical protein
MLSMDVKVYVSRSGVYADIEVRLSAIGAQTPPIPATFLLLIDSSKSIGKRQAGACGGDLQASASMGPTDLVAVYTFDERVKAVLPLTPAPSTLKKAKRFDKV